MKERKVAVYGNGHRKDPYKYALPDAWMRWQREVWKQLGVLADAPPEKPAGA